jgi:hypothetical protein
MLQRGGAPGGSDPPGVHQAVDIPHTKPPLCSSCAAARLGALREVSDSEITPFFTEVLGHEPPVTVMRLVLAAQQAAVSD